MSTKVLLVVDLQPEFKDSDGQYERIVDFVKEHKGYDRVIATKCINHPDGPYATYTDWTDCMGTCEELEFNANITIYKHGYGLDVYEMLDPKCEYDIIGFNTDACVLKVALDLFDRSYKFRVLKDYCYSSNGLGHHNFGVELLERLIPKAIV